MRDLLLHFPLDFLMTAPDFSVVRAESVDRLGMTITMLYVKLDFSSWVNIKDCLVTFKFLNDTIAQVDQALVYINDVGSQDRANDSLQLLNQHGAADISQANPTDRLLFHRIRLTENKIKILRGTQSLVLVALGSRNAFNDISP